MARLEVLFSKSDPTERVVWQKSDMVLLKRENRYGLNHTHPGS